MLNLSYGTSRGRETYGYTIVSLVDTDTGKRYRCMGGGYDMMGTVFGEWLEDVHQAALQAIGPQAYYIGATVQDAGLYGMRYRPDGTVTLDGACGINSMERIAKAIGLSVRHLTTKRGHTTGFVVELAS